MPPPSLSLLSHRAWNPCLRGGNKGSRNLGLLWESLNQPVVRGARPRVFASCKFRLRLQPKALLAEPSFSMAWPRILAFLYLPMSLSPWSLNQPRSWGLHLVSLQKCNASWSFPPLSFSLSNLQLHNNSGHYLPSM